MTVVSISLEDSLLEQLDQLKEELGYSGRSEIFRSAIRSFIAEKKEIDRLEGDVDCLITITHEDGSLNDISEIQHEYQNLVKTQIHDHVKDHKCLQTFVMDGDGGEVREFWERLQSCKKVDQVNLTVL